MTLQKKIIGRVQTDHGTYDPNQSYGKKFQVQLFGCVWESLHDNNNTAPAVWDGGDIITPNTTDWKKASGDYQSWLLKQNHPATTGTTGDYPYNGMGRVELAKNMVNGVNTLTQDMFYKGAVGSRVPNTNTIFVIRYDYVLGEDITVPDNCVLEFDGGSITGAHTLTGNNTGINTGLVKIFNIDITFAGSWSTKAWYPEWFGAKNDKTYNSTTAFQKCLDICKNGGLVKISSGEFLLDTLYFKFGHDCHLEGSGTGATILRMNSAPLITVEDYESTPKTTDGCSYGNFSIRARDGQSDDDITNVCIKHTRIRHGHIHDIDLLQGEAGNSKVYALIHLYGDFTYNTYIDRIRCSFGYIKYGIKTTAKDNNVYNNSNIVNIHNCLFYSNSMEACIDMSCCTQYEIKGCLFESCGKHAIILGQAGDIRGNWIEAFTEQILVFQNNLGTLTSSGNNIGENYFASSNNDIHVPADCVNNSIKGMTLLAPAKVVKDTNSVNVYGLDVSEPTITANGQNTATKNAAVYNCGVWKLEYIVNLPTDQGVTSGLIVCTINTTETCNIRSITASAHDIWNSYKISSVAVRDNIIIVEKKDLDLTMLTVYVEFC